MAASERPTPRAGFVSSTSAISGWLGSPTILTSMATSSSTKAIIERLNALVQEGSTVGPDVNDRSYISGAPMTAWRIRCIAFLRRTLGPGDPYTEGFTSATDGELLENRDKGVALLANLRGDVEGGYLSNFYLGVAGEVLTDMLELATWAD